MSDEFPLPGLISSGGDEGDYLGLKRDSCSRSLALGGRGGVLRGDSDPHCCPIDSCPLWDMARMGD